MLGAQDLRATIFGGALAMGIVLTFLVAYYRIPGLIGAFSMVTYLWLMLAAFVLMAARVAGSIWNSSCAARRTARSIRKWSSAKRSAAAPMVRMTLARKSDSPPTQSCNWLVTGS